MKGEINMTTLDLAPLFRSTVGFDRLPSLFDSIRTSDKQAAYPPYNIELVEEDKYVITMAVAGFKKGEVELVSEQNSLSVKGTKSDKVQKSYLYQGIAERDFERRFRLADHVKVTSAKLEDGILTIELVREVPEAMKPRKIEIQSSNLLES